MPGLVPGIHVFASSQQEDVDSRDKPGHDAEFPVIASQRVVRTRALVIANPSFVIASEAKQSIFRQTSVDCFVAAAPRNDEVRYFARRENHFVSRSQYLSRPSTKNISLWPSGKSTLQFRLVPQEGRFAVVTDLGSGMRWTRRHQARE
jgi:hypothetical protein